MKLSATSSKEKNTYLYRFNKYPAAAVQSVILIGLLVWFIGYLLQNFYPDFKLADNLASFVGHKHNKEYNFFTGQEGGAYYSVGEVIEGEHFEDGDVIKNCATSGGYDNIMRLSIEGNSFAMVQEDVIKQDDQLTKNFRVVAPLFLERMHIFYRKELFKDCGSNLQLSACTNTALLHCISNKVKNINVGLVGSGTRILASYVMTLIGNQITQSLHTVPKYKQIGISFQEAFDRIRADKQPPDSSIDLLFYMQADPVRNIKTVLDLNKYGILSIDASFVATLNKEFNLNLRMADFKKKYEQADNVSTFATLAYLITSAKTGNDDVLGLVSKIEDSKARINRAITKLPLVAVADNPNEYTLKTAKDGYRYTMPLNEYGFFNTYKEEYKTSVIKYLKEIAALAIPVIAFFFPLFKSLNGIKSLIRRWRINKRIDGLVVKPGNVRGPLLALKDEVTDMYGDGILNESHYKPLIDRIDLHLRELPQKKITKKNPERNNHKVNGQHLNGKSQQVNAEE